MQPQRVPSNVTVRERDGIEIELSDGTRVVCDATRPDGDVNAVTHAHTDHLPARATTAVCSPCTAALAGARDGPALERTTDDRVELRPAGHVAGSRAALVTDPDGTQYLYTGDVSTRTRLYLPGFEPPSADVLVVEATYGTDTDEIPTSESVAAAVSSWLATVDAPMLWFGYALGRAQKLQALAARVGVDRVFTTRAIERVNDVVEAHLDVTFDSERYDSTTVTLQEGDVVVLPPRANRYEWVADLVAETDAIKAGFSGWAIDDSYTYRRNYDVGFPLTDHCDFPDLLALVDAVDPDDVYTTHGATDALATELTARGYDATALREHQTTLTDF